MITKSASTRLLSTTTSKIKKKVDCAVYGCGLSASGALAIPKLMNRNNDGEVSRREVEHPKRVTFFNTHGIKHISSGFGFSLFASDSKLFGAGLNNKLQIGGYSTGRSQEYYISAKKTPIPSGKILEISSGRAHSLIRTSSGVYAIGDNNFGQCGRNPEETELSIGTPDSQLCPLEIPTEHEIVSIHCSLDSSFVVDSAGQVFSFGLNEDGQCANGGYGIQWQPRKVSGDVEGVKIQKVVGSTDTLLAIGEAGDVFIWGQTEYKQTAGASDEIQLSTSRALNLDKSIGQITSAATTSTSVIVKNQQGEVFVWGVGVLGMGPDADVLKRPTRMDQPLFDNKPIAEVFAGNSAMSAINSSGRLFVWGENRFSSLGLGHSKRQLFPYQVFLPGDVKTSALGPDHSLFLVI